MALSVLNVQDGLISFYQLKVDWILFLNSTREV